MAKKPSKTAEQETAAPQEYRVLARKYRPQNFSELKGQDALVRTLTNAITTGRIAHAFMLTGVRGVGKTTTARIIARALNCVGTDGRGGPTPDPCGQCEHCVAIGQDRHVDVLEMDAASRTGVDDIREIIDSVRYGAVSARYKIYIIDEVHMLSKPAFNALLKTLEEPPPHVKFVFATTEIRKVPVTVLSRCQRFDLRRIDAEVLESFFAELAVKENVETEPEAIRLIARAADGSARDGLSLLDRAISLEGKKITEERVRDMLGLADRTVVLDLLEALMKGDAIRGLDIFSSLRKAGADPLVVLQDLLELVHFLTLCRAAPETARDAALPEAERTRGAALAASVSMPALTRAWQLLLKGLTEVQHAPQPHHAAEMILVRLVYAADLPAPGDLVKQIQETGAVAAPSPTSRGTSSGFSAPANTAVSALSRGSAAPQPQIQTQTEGATALLPMPQNFRALADMFATQGEALLNSQLYSMVHLVRFEMGRLELRLKDDAPPQLASRVGQKLTQWTGQRWVVSVSTASGEPSLSEQEKSDARKKIEEATAHPAVQAVIHAFPGARIVTLHEDTLEEGIEE